MSFGFGVGDVLTLSKLAWDVYNAYKDAPGKFQNISHELKSLHIIIAREQDGLRNKTFDPEDQAELQQILLGCESVLRDLDNLLDKHKGLAAGEGSVSRFVVRVKLSFEDISELRARLVSNTLLFNTFITRCAMDEIKDLIANGAYAPGTQVPGTQVPGTQVTGTQVPGTHAPGTHVSGLRRAGSISSLASFASSLNSKAIWKKLCRDLHNAGVTAEVIRQRGPEVITFLQSETDPGARIVDSQNISTSQVPVLEQNDGELSKPDANGKSGSTTVGSNGVLPGPIQVAVPSPVAAAGAGVAGRVVRVLLNVFRDVDARLPTAAGSGRIDVVRQLLKKGANIEATRSDNGATALDSAAYFGHADIVKLLLEKGANIEATRSDNGGTALNSAAYRGHADVVKLLLEKGAIIEATRSDTSGATPLDSGAHGGHADVVKLLLEKGANIEATRSNTGGTALDTAAWRGHADVVKLLLEKGANIEARRIDGATPLSSAARHGHTGIVSLLLKKGANTKDDAHASTSTT